MTTLDEAEEAVHARFVAQWAATTLFVFANEQFDDQGDAPWVRLTISNLPRNQETLGKPGNRKFRSQAIVFVQVYTLVNTGVKQGNSLAKQAADIFEGVSFSGLDFNAATVRKTGPTGKWYQHLAEAPFDYDEIK